MKSNTCNGSLCDVVVKNNAGSGLSFGNEQYLYPQQTSGPLTANANPTLAVSNGLLYMAYTGAPNNNYIISSPDGTNWSAPYQIAVGYSTWYSPVMTADPSTNPNELWITLMSGSTKTPILCEVLPDTSNISYSSQDCQNLTSLDTVSYNPGIAVHDGVIYLGFANGSNGCLYFYKLNATSWNPSFWNPLSSCQATNAAPSLAIHNGYLYAAFRTGGNANTFTVAISPDFQSMPYLEKPGFGMAGPGDLLPLDNSQTGNPDFLLNFYTYENRLYYTYGE